MAPTTTAQDSAFVDVISNTLMVVLVMTLLLVVVSGLRVAGEPAPADAAEAELRLPERELFPPWSRYYLVAAQGLIELDLAAIVSLLEHDRLTADGSAGARTSARVSCSGRTSARTLRCARIAWASVSATWTAFAWRSGPTRTGSQSDRDRH
jgi:hypothetical protein